MIFKIGKNVSNCIQKKGTQEFLILFLQLFCLTLYQKKKLPQNEGRKQEMKV